MDYTERQLCAVEGCNNLRKKVGTKCTRHCQSPETFAAKRLRYRKSIGRGHSEFKGDSCENPECQWTGDYISFLLDVDHIDGNHQNNDPLNLMTLCANCHRLKTANSRDFLAREYRQIDIRPEV